MKRFFLFTLVVLFIQACSFNSYQEIASSTKQKFVISQEEALAMVSFTHLEADMGKQCAEQFYHHIDQPLKAFVIAPTVTDSILASHNIVAFPFNQPLSKPLLQQLSQHLTTRYFMIAHITQWEDGSRTNDGMVKQLMEIYDLTSQQLIWQSEGQVHISATGDEQTLAFVGHATDGYKKMISKTLAQLRKESNLREDVRAR